MDMQMRLKSILALTLISLTCPVEAEEKTSCKVSKAQYDAIKNGMTEALTIKILGCNGIELSSNDIGGSHTVMYGWSGTGKGKMSATFKDDALIAKYQLHLE
jgi:hypothetical protein